MATSFDASVIAAALPHADPFLFLNSAELDGKTITGVYQITGEEDFLRGHFKGNPVFPASIMLEALGQLAVFYLLAADDESLTQKVDPGKILFTACDGVRCSRICQPGDKLEMVVKPRRIRHPGATFEGKITVNGEKAVFAEEISLKFDYAS
ncbi:3-hydroxyacyl-ACP dehydratase FabZ family protein [Cerasicoccus fimbriatus]|uniref:3-hydroxyacyl-ACP dehydratase FabZ family protein n=1 Tax=Cerasicoccus fimbriatus TaxID=3014554 RepID=UPI0022B31F12|nr:hypothetical protein [Cerasicoccus sp. TK19100]